MKNYRPNKIVLGVIFLFAFVVLKSDIIPENSHQVQRTVQITNCSDFPDIQFVGYITGPMADENDFYLIDDDQSLHKGYKFNSLYVFGIKKSRLTELGGVENLTQDYVLEKVDPGAILSSETLFISNSSMLEKEEIFYEMEKVTDDVFVAKLKTHISYFSDNSKDVEEY
ncbi:hypothetical protein [uncultured Draconibacterium sp.]|uniref:hypothetical protein n=1 Tax=uncultured Draconibacterium sp. TaxID=1573823 RepID=UPI0025ED357F|nr:hypothetical protein [uncultured Draconibacterium sp.]